LDAAIDALVDALAELPEHELEGWQRGNPISSMLKQIKTGGRLTPLSLGNCWSIESYWIT
jgi:hypothetical protein